MGRARHRDREYANLWDSLRRRCGCLVVVHRAEGGIAMTEGVFERIVQDGCSHSEDGLHRRPVPAHLLLLDHAGIARLSAHWSHGEHGEEPSFDGAEHPGTGLYSGDR
jgi:hypothetical protein